MLQSYLAAELKKEKESVLKLLGERHLLQVCMCVCVYACACVRVCVRVCVYVGVCVLQ